MTELDLLVQAIAEDLDDPSDWGAPVEFRDSLALCALNSAYSLRGSSAAATNVLARYRAFRPTADTDSGPDLLKAMDSAGCPADFARDILRNESKLPGTNRLRGVWTAGCGSTLRGCVPVLRRSGGGGASRGLLRGSLCVIDYL